jgi:hypothetical protein
MDPYIQRLENKPLKHLVMDGAGRVGIDHADEVVTADRFIGSWLMAKKPISIYDRPGGSVINIRKYGENVGRVFSFVNRDGSVWWQLEGGSGNGTGGWVKHEKGAFDQGIAEKTSSGAEHDAVLESLKVPDPLADIQAGFSSATGGIGKALSGFGENLNMIIILAIGAVILVAWYKLSKL